MRTSLAMALAVCLAAAHCRAQNSSDTLSRDEVETVLDRQFTSLITGQSKSSVGNFASLDLKEAEVSFSGSAILGNRSILSIKGSGGVSDGLFSIFTNSKLNTNISLDVQYNRLLPKKNFLRYNDDLQQVYRARERQTWQDFWLDSLSVAFHQQQSLLILKETSLKTLEGKLNAQMTAETTVVARKDSLRYELAKVAFQRHLDSTALGQYADSSGRLRILENARSIRLKALAQDSMAAATGFKLKWLSIGLKVQSNSFRLFEPSATYDNQIVKTSFVSGEARLQYSYYQWSSAAYESFFWCVGLALSYKDNLSDLTATEVSDVTNYGPTPNGRTTTKKYTAYVGEYKKHIKGLRVYADWYCFLFKGNIGAFHLYPEWLTQGYRKPSLNLGVGFLLSFKGDKDPSSVVNAELYYNWLDVLCALDRSYGLFEKNSIGIRFSFPIKFKT
jgi:hypothetical protein